MAGIFEKIRLAPTQLRTVADRRFDDADYLRRSNDNRHANGVYYLGGFVLECLLKALMIEKYPELQKPPIDIAALSPLERHRFNLVYRWDDLKALLAVLPDTMNTLRIADPPGRLVGHLTALCEQWNVFARYSPRTAMMEDASRFLTRIKELKKWLR